jgi:NitT/TauT family transport system permease protein
MKKTDKTPIINRPRLRTALLASAGIIAAFLLWQTIGMVVLAFSRESRFQDFLPDFMPVPAIMALMHLLLEPQFYQSLFASLVRILTGIVISLVIGISGGLLVGHFKTLEKITSMPLQFLRMVSPIAWMPIALLMLPGFEWAIIFIIAVSTIWPVMLNTIHGVHRINRNWILMARNQGARESQLLFKVILPGAMPMILNGIRQALGVAWIVLVPAEFLGVTSGLGYLINDARDSIEYSRMIAVILAIGLVGFILDISFSLAKKKLSWRERQ